ncbi:MAG: helix-turn-helix transcriptional regulator [Cyanobacteria bacterium P01_D01_bin.50]
MPTGDDERKQRLSILCKRLRGEESLRSFTKKRSQELGGITFTTWGAWENGKAGLSPGSLARLVNFIGCSHQLLYRYLDGIITLEELLQPTQTNDAEPNEQLDFSPDAAAVWINSLAPEEKLFIASQSFQSFQKQIDDLVEQRAEKLVGQEVKLLISLLSGDDYPAFSEIAEVADKLNLKTEDLIKLCSRIYSKSK